VLLKIGNVAITPSVNKVLCSIDRARDRYFPRALINAQLTETRQFCKSRVFKKQVYNLKVFKNSRKVLGFKEEVYNLEEINVFHS
jgi:hypothetical protein